MCRIESWTMNVFSSRASNLEIHTRLHLTVLVWRVPKDFCVTRDRAKISRVMRDWDQISRVMRDRRSWRDEWFAILQASDAWFTS